MGAENFISTVCVSQILVSMKGVARCIGEGNNKMDKADCNTKERASYGRMKKNNYLDAL